jgi:polysaccharide biosynthesis/export protein
MFISNRSNARSTNTGALSHFGISTLIVWLFTLSTACVGPGNYVWVNDAPDMYFKPPPALTISPGDLISVRVFGQEPLSVVRTTVRMDGAIAMPLIGDIAVAGKSPTVVAREVEARLKPFVTTPNVVVVVDESRIRIVAIGEVRRTGTIVLEAGETGLLSALANAGGLTDFASHSGVYVVRPEVNGVIRIRFAYEDIIRGVGRAAIFRLRSGDQLVVE